MKGLTVKFCQKSFQDTPIWLNEKQNAGSYSVVFDAKNYPGGVYYYKLEAGSFSKVRKMILLK